MKPLCAYVAMLLLLWGCASNEVGFSKDVSQDEISQTYFVSYDEAADKTEITAFFRFAGPNGTTLILSEPSTIKLNGEELGLTQSDLSGAFYSKTFNGPMPDGEYVFEFTDTDGKLFTNKLKWRNFEVDSMVWNKAGDLVLKFSADPELRDEELNVDVADTATSVREYFKTVNGKAITVKAEKLLALRGTLRLEVKREGNSNLRQQTHAGGFIYTEYRLKPIGLSKTE